MEKKKLRILIIDDNRSFRLAVRQFLTNELNYEVVGEASDGTEFLKLMKSVNVDIVLMDIQMPELDGITVTKRWCLTHTQTKIIAVTMFTEKAYLQTLIEAGFKGCVFKTNFFTEIINAIDAVSKGKIYFDKNMPIA
jgi:DNA-binding NarL/FixJ family response regulator